MGSCRALSSAGLTAKRLGPARPAYQTRAVPAWPRHNWARSLAGRAGPGRFSPLDTAASYVSALLRGTKDPHLRNVLGQCKLLYWSASLAIKNVPDAQRFKMYGMYGVAMNDLNITRGYPGQCQDTFRRNPPLIYPVELTRNREFWRPFALRDWI